MFRSRIKVMKIHIEKGELLSFGRGEIKLNCVRGTLWITWPGSGDVILREGEELNVRQHGRLCVTAVTGSFIQVKMKKIFPCVREIPRIAAVKLIHTLAAGIRNSGGESAFGGSVHSITR